MSSNFAPGNVQAPQELDLQQIGNTQTMLDGPVSNGYSNLIIDTDKRLQLIISSGCRWRRRKSVRIASQSSVSSKEQGIEGSPLHLFMDLPLDLTYEIAKYLGPFDLNTFVNLNKRFRAVFLRRPSVTIWRQCIANGGLPPCPTDMTEPQHADWMGLPNSYHTLPSG
ncbi:hypothetical protein BDN70DRAFT_134873 [Pholiota conissans]|uniref:F-box domain-containing protein n=1 Tax=Pholiota conissans TaxID=109636 RepID=A0A9P5YWH2_9AGAR|nr:hypothetical protein BDN70DRAFT_134873 [Pholiota conissans]